MMKHFKTMITLFLIAYCSVVAAGFSSINDAFQNCHDYSDSNEPLGAKRLYKIVRSSSSMIPKLDPVEEAEVKGKFVFESVVEDVRFTTYKCWDRDGNITGFDAQLLTEILALTQVNYVRFIPIKWENIATPRGEQLSFFAKLNEGVGHVAMAGMSITEERTSWGDMIGPIYKAGKKLMGRNDNIRIGSELINIPVKGYESLRGLSVLVQDSSIRGQFFKEMQKKYPKLVKYATFDEKGNVNNIDPDKFMIVETKDFEVVNEFIDNLMRGKVFGVQIDLVMIDTGSTISLIEEGKLGVETSVVTGNLSADQDLGHIFGLGDGIALKKNSILTEPLRKALKAVIRDGKVDALIERWFQDENGADHSWAL